MNARQAVVLLAIAWAGGCSDHPDPLAVTIDPPPPPGPIVSDPTVPPPMSASAIAVAGDGVVAYVSLTPNTVDEGSVATVRSLLAGATVLVGIRDGGFDPVPVTASVGDTIEIVVRDALGATVYHERMAVAARRPPIVVRTYPPPRKRDVALNTAIVVVFSEPVDAATLTKSSIRLLRGPFPILGSVGLLVGTTTSVVFTPSASLMPNTEYELVVTEAVRDLDGDALVGALRLIFKTGIKAAGPALLTVEPESVTVLLGQQVQLTAGSRDTSALPVYGRPVTWSTGNPSVATVSATGLVTAVAAGEAFVRGELEGQGDEARVTVLPAGSIPAVFGIWDWTEVVNDPNARVTCSDTGSYVFNQRGFGFTGASEGFGTCVTPTGPVDRGSTGTVSDGSVADGTITFTVASNVVCTYTAPLTENPLDQVRGAVTCGNGESGTWQAVRQLPVASVTLVPDTISVVTGLTGWLYAQTRDASGRRLLWRPLTWSSDHPAVATPTAAGWATAQVIVVGAGAAAITATTEGIGGSSIVRGVTIVDRFAGVWSGSAHTCGLTPTGMAVCWGVIEGQPDNDGNPTECVLCSPIPDTVLGGLNFFALTAGMSHTCGLTANGAAYCWGRNAQGQLGSGTGSDSRVPTPVAGGLTFTALAAGAWHTCGLTLIGVAYCWGWNGWYQLGDGTQETRTTPTPVAGGLTFAAITAGDLHTCGLTFYGAAYCWGSNHWGQLGTGGDVRGPVAVRGGLVFAALSAGSEHTCGLTAGGAAYCWGANPYGQLGNGTTSLNGTYTPNAVVGGLAFTALSAGQWHSCGLASNGTAYCWGWGEVGALGSGSTGSSFTPLRVAGNTTFASVSASHGWHTCALTASGTAYCWGNGQSGDGTFNGSYAPVKVPGQP